MKNRRLLLPVWGQRIVVVDWLAVADVVKKHVSVPPLIIHAIIIAPSAGNVKKRELSRTGAGQFGGLFAFDDSVAAGVE